MPLKATDKGPHLLHWERPQQRRIRSSCAAEGGTWEWLGYVAHTAAAAASSDTRSSSAGLAPVNAQNIRCHQLLPVGPTPVRCSKNDPNHAHKPGGTIAQPPGNVDNTLESAKTSPGLDSDQDCVLHAISHHVQIPQACQTPSEGGWK